MTTTPLLEEKEKDVDWDDRVFKKPTKWVKDCCATFQHLNTTANHSPNTYYFLVD
jgi:hypothetical protein